MDKEKVKQTEAFYDVEANTYDMSRYSNPAGIRRDRFHKITLAALLGSGADNKDMLELGCGTGRLAVDVATYTGRVFGVDVSTNMLNVAKERLSNMEIDNVSLISGDVNHLPLPDNHFDGVYAILVLNLLPDIESIFSEVARVVKKDGIFVFNLPNLSSIYFAGGAYVNMRGKTVTKNEAGYRYSQWYTYSQVSEMLRKSGFSLDVVVGQPPLLRFSNWQQCGTRSAVGYFFSKSLYYKARRL